MITEPLGHVFPLGVPGGYESVVKRTSLFARLAIPAPVGHTVLPFHKFSGQIHSRGGIIAMPGRDDEPFESVGQAPRQPAVGRTTRTVGVFHTGHAFYRAERFPGLILNDMANGRRNGLAVLHEVVGVERALSFLGVEADSHGMCPRVEIAGTSSPSSAARAGPAL